MRAYELEESAVEELKDRLPKLKRHNYNTIDRLMQDISVRHKITGKKLHDMFVRKYGHTPDTWIKKIKNRVSEEDIAEVGNFLWDKPKPNPVLPIVSKIDKVARELTPQNVNTGKQIIQSHTRDITRILSPKDKTGIDVIEGDVVPLKRPMNKVQHGKRTFPPTQRDVKKPEGNVTPLIQKKSNVSEGVEGPEDIQKIKDFIKWSYKTLNMQKPYPKITISKNTEVAQSGHHTGVHKGNNIWIYVGNRNLIDIFRTIFHELTHHRQMQLNMIKDGDSYPGSPIEMLADMAAGKYIKIYGKDHPEMFQ